MPRDPLFPETNAPTRARSPDTAGGSERKRRRKVLSCYDCRRRKLQCDRQLPACGRCTKAGQAANCLYIDEAVDSLTRPLDAAVAAPVNAKSDVLAISAIPAHPPGDLLSRLEYQDRRIKELEAALSQHGHAKSHTLALAPEVITTVGDLDVSAADRETMLLRGKSFKTQFHGISHPGSLIGYIPGLVASTKETFEKFPGLSRLRQDLHALEDRADRTEFRHQVTNEADLKALLPGKAECDALIKLYLETFDTIYHIIHTPTFQREYDEMWDDPATVRGRFVALLLLMMATVHCLQEIEPWMYTANSSSARDKSLFFIRACDDWLMSQSQKHVTAIDFQIRFLLNLAKLANASKFKRTWTDAGTFLRFCQAAGLHRNPELLRKPTSAFDKEMRRRVWFAAAEFELQTAFARGMISAPWPQQSDYVPPSNLNDAHFDEETLHLPPPLPLGEFTSTSYMVVANQSFMTRYTLNTILNNVRQRLSFDEAKRYTEEIETHLQSIPSWDKPESDAARELLAISLRNHLLVLHDRQIRQTSSPIERNFSKMVVLDAAKKIIAAHKTLMEKKCRPLQFLCHDQMRAAFSVCHVFSLSTPQSDAMLYDVIVQTATTVIEDAALVIGEKTERLGCEQRQLWLVLAAQAFVKTKLDPGQKLVWMQESVDKVVRYFYKILACQEDLPSAISSGPPTGRADLPDGVMEYLPSTAVRKPDTNGAGDPALLDFDAIAAWTFDDWTFNPGEFATLDNPY